MALQDYVTRASELNEFNLKTYLGFPISESGKREFERGYNELAEISRQHLNSRQFRTSKGNGNLWVVHPSCEEIDNGERPKQIQKLLDYIRRNRERHRTVIVSDAIDYIINDHNFVESGLFDGVILTENNQGKPLELSDLNPFKDAQQHLVGGCYVGMCLDVFVETLEEQVPSRRIKVVRKWYYDPTNLTLAERIYNVFYFLSPPALRRRLTEPRNRDGIFLPHGSI